MNIPFIKYKKVPLIFSSVLAILGFVIIGIFGLKPGIDFTGGSLLEVGFTGTRPEVVAVQEALAPLNFGTVVAQPSGETGIVVKSRFISEEEHQQMLGALRSAFENDDNKVLEQRLETIGPAVGETLRKRAVNACIAVVLAILLYIAYTFRRVSRPVSSWKYALCAIFALLHDVGLTIAAFSILGHFYGVEVNVPFIVALLTIFGFSIHDTIVVFDRVRENLTIDGPRNFAETVNRSMNETLSRSINTSLTTLIPIAFLYAVGGASIHYFALALLIGITLGTYSSIFVASALLVVWFEYQEKKKVTT